jgi:hypothetical protein
MKCRNAEIHRAIRLAERTSVRMRFSLKSKLLVVIGLLGLVPIVGVALNSYNLSASKRAGAARDSAWHGVEYLESSTASSMRR